MPTEKSCGSSLSSWETALILIDSPHVVRTGQSRVPTNLNKGASPILCLLPIVAPSFKKKKKEISVQLSMRVVNHNGDVSKGPALAKAVVFRSRS